MKIRYLLPMAALLAMAGIASAGLSQPAPVMIDLEISGDPDNNFAQGDQLTARTAKNDVEFIGCGIRVFDDGVNPTFAFGFCQAGDSEEVEGFCSTQRADLLEAINALSDFSFISFSWNAAGECTRIGSSTQSFYLPKFKTKGKK